MGKIKEGAQLHSGRHRRDAVLYDLSVVQVARTSFAFKLPVERHLDVSRNRPADVLNAEVHDPRRCLGELEVDHDIWQIPFTAVLACLAHLKKREYGSGYRDQCS